MSDAQIVTAVLSGDTAQYEVLVERYLGLVRSVCGSYEYQRESCEDLIQDTFIDGYMKLNRLRDASRFGPWVAQIARNKSKSWVRQQSRRREVHDQLEAESADLSDSNLLSELSKKEMREWVQGCIHTLPLKTREAMLLYYVESYTIGEAARCLNVRESAIKKRLQFGRERVGEQLCKDMRESPRDDDAKTQSRKIVTALPLASAPWLQGGTAAAAGLSGLSSLTSWWIAGPVVAGLVCVAAVVVPDLLETEVDPLQEVASEEVLDVEDKVKPADDVEEVPETTPVSETPDETEDSGATVDKSIRVVYSLYDHTMLPDGKMQTKLIAGPSVPGVTVRLTPSTKVLSPAFITYLEKVGLTAREIKLMTSRFSLDPETIFTEVEMQENKELGESIHKKMQAKSEVKPPRDAIITKLQEEHAQTAVTNASGECQFTDLPIGQYQAQLSFPELNVSTPPIGSFYDVMVGGEAPTQQTLRMKDYKSAIRGQVVSKETREPIKHVNVQLKWKNEDQRGSMDQTDEQGIFEISSEFYGEFELTLSSDRHYAKAVQGIRNVGESSDLTLEVEASAAVYGRVLNADGSPAEGISIMRQSVEQGSSSGVATSGNDGRYRAVHDGGIVTLYASKITAKADKIQFDLSRNESVEHDFILPPAAQVKFSIHDAQGTVPDEIDRGSLLKTNFTGNSRSSMGFNAIIKDEHWLLPYLTEGVYDVWIYVEGYQSESRHFVVDDASKDQAIEILLKEATLSAELNLRDAQGQAVKSKSMGVYEVNDDGSKRSNRASLMKRDPDDSGRCLFEKLWPGTFYFFSGRQGVTVTLPHSGEIVLTIEDDTKKQPESFYVEKEDLMLYTKMDAERPLSNQGISFVIIPPSGEINSDAYAAECELGTNEIYVFKLGYTVGVGTFYVDENWNRQDSHPINITLEESASIFGQVSDAQGVTIANQRLFVLPASVWENRSNLDYNQLQQFGTLLAQGLRSNQDGEFYIDFLPEGRFYVGIVSNNNNFNLEKPSSAYSAGPFEIVPGHETGPVVLSIP